MPTAALRMPLPVGSLANSTYVLRIEATAGEQTAQQWVAFRVAALEPQKAQIQAAEDAEARRLCGRR